MNGLKGKVNAQRLQCRFEHVGSCVCLPDVAEVVHSIAVDVFDVCEEWEVHVPTKVAKNSEIVEAHQKNPHKLQVR